MKTKTEKLDDALTQFTAEKDPIVHRVATETLLSSVGLVERFSEILEEENGVRDFFLLWVRAGKEEEDPQERKGLKKIGESSKKLYEQKKYGELCEFFYDILFRHLAELLHLEEREDFETITDHDLYKKNIIPSEIFFQYFLIEFMVKNADFDWDRGEEIANQNLACFITCFGDIYEFFHEGEEISEEKSFTFKASNTHKIGRNEPCRCGSGIKSKKCCGEIKEEKIKCGLCGNSRNLQKTDCCGNWICNDANEYVVFSYARNSCSRNHDRYTLCGYHKNEEHKGDWKTCKKCLDGFSHELEMYVWYGTNEYNFTKLENPPAFKLTYCGKCGKHLVLPAGGFSVLCGEYRCDECPISNEEREAIIQAYKKK